LRCDALVARAVEEIMNRELLAIGPDTPAAEIRELLRAFAIGAAPVLDAWRRPLGVVSARDLLDAGDCVASDRMRAPALCVPAEASIRDAARRLARTDEHHLVVVDGGGRAIGMLSIVDLLRALVGVPARHPSTFPHWDAVTQTSWTDDWPLDEGQAAHAPDGPGVLVLVSGRLGERDEIVWAESCADLRGRAQELASSHASQPPALTRLLEARDLRFRAAPIGDPARRDAVASRLRARIDLKSPPGGGAPAT
jgi:CBS domain-containing protein